MGWDVSRRPAAYQRVNAHRASRFLWPGVGETMTHLALVCLGAFQATLDGKPLTAFRSAKVQGLLVYLALGERQPHARETLAALFWPDEPDAVARKNLRQSLYQLRQVLQETAAQEKPHLLATRSTAQFNPDSDHALDVADFLSLLESDQLEQATALYRGDLLPGFTCDSLPFEEWLRRERERLHRLALDALFELNARCLERADYRAAESLAQRQLALEPWREEAHRQLMQALSLRGERSAALTQYEACRAVLARELGVEPSTETEALAAHIRGRQPKPRTRHPSSHTFERRRLTMPFIGRHREHDALARAYRRACKEGVQVVALLGEAGIGKTRLAQNFLDWAAAQGADVLRGRAFETSGRLSYQPLAQLLRQRLERENAPEDLLSDLWLTQLARILPELRDRYPDLPQPTQEEAVARQHLFEAITRFGQALATRSPLILFVDDWHWADPTSLDVLHYAALRWSEERTPILVLLTLRRNAVAESPDLQGWLSRLKRDVACEQLTLTSFSATETGQLIHALFEPEEEERAAAQTRDQALNDLTQFSRWLFEETDGQPFFLVETLKALVEEGLIRPGANSNAWRIDRPKLNEQMAGAGPRVLPGVREIIRGWLNRISAPAGEMLSAAAVLGEGATFDNLCRVAGLEEIQALTALDELLARQLLLETNEALSSPGHDAGYSFSHQKLGEVIYAEAGAARRRILHRRAFEALREGATPVAQLAHHAANAGLLAETIQYSIAAGNEALALFAVRVAIAHYETARRVAEHMAWPETVSGADRQGLFVGLGRAYELAEDWPQAQKTYQAMIVYAQRNEAATVECLGLNRLATVHINGFKEPKPAFALLEQARTVAQRSGDRRGLAETEWNLSVAARMAQDAHQARIHGEQALALARELGHPQLLARCLNSLAYAHVYSREWDKIEAYADEARELYAATGNRILEADSQRLVGWSQIFSGRLRESVVTLEETLTFSRQIDNLWGEAECEWRLACALMESGRYGEAIEMAERAVEQARRVDYPTMIVLALAACGAVQRTIMDLDSARATLSEALAEVTEKGLSGFEDWVLAELCAVHALAGERGLARDYAIRRLECREGEPMTPLGLTGRCETEALLRGGDDDLARREVERLGKMIGNNKRFRLLWLQSLAVLAQWDNEAGRAIRHLQEALELAREIGIPGEEWSILDALGQLHAGRGDQSETQQARSAAAAIIQNLVETMDEEDRRKRFLTTEPIRAILQGGRQRPL